MYFVKNDKEGDVLYLLYSYKDEDGDNRLYEAKCELVYDDAPQEIKESMAELYIPKIDCVDVDTWDIKTVADYEKDIKNEIDNWGGVLERVELPQ